MSLLFRIILCIYIYIQFLRENIQPSESGQTKSLFELQGTSSSRDRLFAAKVPQRCKLPIVADLARHGRSLEPVTVGRGVTGRARRDARASRGATWQHVPFCAKLAVHQADYHCNSLTSSNKDASRNKCIATSNKCLTSSNKKVILWNWSKGLQNYAITSPLRRRRC